MWMTQSNWGQLKASWKWPGRVIPWPGRVLPGSTLLGQFRARAQAGGYHYRLVRPIKTAKQGTTKAQ